MGANQTVDFTQEQQAHARELANRGDFPGMYRYLSEAASANGGETIHDGIEDAAHAIQDPKSWDSFTDQITGLLHEMSKYTDDLWSLRRGDKVRKAGI